MNLTDCWINTQTRPVEFICGAKASSFTCSNNKKAGLTSWKPEMGVFCSLFTKPDNNDFIYEVIIKKV